MCVWFFSFLCQAKRGRWATFLGSSEWSRSSYRQYSRIRIVDPYLFQSRSYQQGNKSLFLVILPDQIPKAHELSITHEEIHNGPPLEGSAR